MRYRKETLSKFLKWGLAATAIVVVGRCAMPYLDYYGEARAVRALAEDLEGVEILDVDGNHDLTLESLWLAIRYQGDYICFNNVTPDSFDENSNLQVSNVGGWSLATIGVEQGVVPPAGDNCWLSGSKSKCHFWGGCLDFGADGDIGREFDPPIRNIPDFLHRLPEVRAALERLPTSPPGRIVGSIDCRIPAGSGEIKDATLAVWGYRTSARGPWEE